MGGLIGTATLEKDGLLKASNAILTYRTTQGVSRYFEIYIDNIEQKTIGFLASIYFSGTYHMVMMNFETAIVLGDVKVYSKNSNCDKIYIGLDWTNEFEIKMTLHPIGDFTYKINTVDSIPEGYYDIVKKIGG